MPVMLRAPPGEAKPPTSLPAATAAPAKRTTAAPAPPQPRFAGPPPMDKVRPENQSEHTPVRPCPSCCEPLLAKLNPRPHSPRPPPHPQKEQPQPRPLHSHDSRDRRQWIKYGLKIRASTRR